MARRFKEVFDGVGSDSLLFVLTLVVDLFELGGGDFSRGDVGHAGVFGFCDLSDKRPPSAIPSLPAGS